MSDRRFTPRLEILEDRLCPSTNGLDASAVAAYNANQVANYATLMATPPPGGSGPLFFMVIDGVSTPQYDYSNMDMSQWAGFWSGIPNIAPQTSGGIQAPAIQQPTQQPSVQMQPAIQPALTQAAVPAALPAALPSDAATAAQVGEFFAQHHQGT